MAKFNFEMYNFILCHFKSLKIKFFPNNLVDRKPVAANLVKNETRKFKIVNIESSESYFVNIGNPG